MSARRSPLSVAFGAVLTYVAEDLLDFKQKELFEAVTSILAVVFVTWMIFWMRRFSRSLAKDLRGRLEEAIGLGTFAVVVMAFLAVAREGLETALLFYAAAQGATTSAGPLIGISLGVLTAVGLGWFLYAGAIRINLSVFFRWTGLALIIVAAGIFKYGVHDLQESGVLPGLSTLRVRPVRQLRRQHLVRRPAHRHGQLHRHPDLARDGRVGRLSGAGAGAVPPPRARQHHPGPGAGSGRRRLDRTVHFGAVRLTRDRSPASPTNLLKENFRCVVPTCSRPPACWPWQCRPAARTPRPPRATRPPSPPATRPARWPRRSSRPE